MLDLVEDQGVDLALCVGDLVDGDGDASACCRMLMEAGVVTVRGNHDRWFLEDRDFRRETFGDHRTRALDADARTWLEALPALHRIDTVAGRVLLCHGLGSNDMCGVEPGMARQQVEQLPDWQREGSGARVVLLGHTHRAMMRRIGGTVLLNPGALGGHHPRIPADRGLAILDLGAGTRDVYDASDAGVRHWCQDLLPLP